MALLGQRRNWDTRVALRVGWALGDSRMWRWKSEEKTPEVVRIPERRWSPRRE